MRDIDIDSQWISVFVNKNFKSFPLLTISSCSKKQIRENFNKDCH